MIVLVHLEAEYKVGTAPPSESERKVQKAIDDLKGKLRR
jgi:hypothetical protein